MIIDSPIISGSYLSTGSLSQTGNVSITGSLTATAGISGSFSGSGANLFDIPAAGIVGLNLSQIASGSVSASISPNQGLLINTSVSASNFTGSFTGSLTGIATSASYASFALTSSYSLGGSGFPFSGSAVITGSLIVSGSGLTITGSVAISTLTTGSGVRYVIADANGLISAQTASAVIFTTQQTIATAGQTVFPITNGYSTGYVTVFVNGSKLNEDEFTDTSGTNIVFATGSMVNDVVEFQKYLPASGVSNNTLRTTNYFTTTLGQTNFTVNYTPGLLDVFYNGSKLSNTEYTAANGTSILLATGSNAGDTVEVDVYSYQVGAFSGIGGSGVARELAFYNTSNSITGSNKVTYDGSTFSVTGSFLVTGSSTFTNIGPAVFSGSVTAVGGFSGSFSGNADSASLAQNSLLLQGTGSVGFTTTASFLAVSASQQQLSSSYIALSASYNVASSSFSTRITSDSSSISSRTTQVERTYATTGSNTFTGVQNFSNTCTPNGFNSGASLYTAGGLQVTQDTYFSSSVYIKGNVTVYGTQSVSYVSSSQFNIGTNIITVNTFTPSVRFGGLSVFDSGSTGLTGSIFWDSELNRWIYTNASGSGGGATYGGGMFISGPRNTQGLGCEQGTTACMLLVGQGGDHMTSSMIYHDSAVTCIPGAFLASGCVGIGVSAPTLKLDVRGTLGIPATSGTSQYGYLRLTSNAGSSRTLDFGGYDSGRNYAMWMQATDWADLSVNSSLIINPNGGNVGIGTCTPGYKLDVNGEVAISPNTAGKNTFILTTNASNDGRLLIKSDTTNKVDIQSNGSTYFNGGNVGINCTTPNYKLHVNGCTSIDGNLRMGSGYSSGNSTDPVITVQGYSNAGVYFANCGVGLGAGSSTNLLFLSCLGNVSIGTESAYGKLSVVSSDNTVLSSALWGGSLAGGIHATVYNNSQCVNSVAGLKLITRNSGASHWSMYNVSTGASTGDLAFGHGSGGTGYELLRITNGGNVGLSTVAPASLLSAYNTTSTAISQMYISGPASNGTGGGNRGFDASFTSTITSFTGTDNADQGYGYFPLTIVNGQTYTIHFKSTAVNGTLGTIITSTGTNFATDSVQTISLPTITDGALTSIRFTATGAATYIGFAGYRTSGTMSLTISEVSIVSGIPDIETGAIVAYKGVATNRINIQAPTTACIPVLGCADCTTGLVISNFDTRYGMLLGSLNTGVGWIQQGRFDGTATSYGLSLQPNGGKVGIGSVSPNWLLEICCNTTATGGGGYPAISINNPNDAGYSAYYFFKGTTNMGGMEVSNATCGLLLNTLCTLNFQTNNNTRIRICNTGESYFACKPSFPGATLTCTYTCTYSSYTAGCWLGLFAGDNGYNGAYAFTVVGQFNLGGSGLYTINYSSVPYIHKSDSIGSTNGNDFYGIAHTSSGHADNGALVCFRRARYSGNTPGGNRTEFCMNVSYSTSFTATTYVLAWV